MNSMDMLMDIMPPLDADIIRATAMMMPTTNKNTALGRVDSGESQATNRWTPSFAPPKFEIMRFVFLPWAIKNPNVRQIVISIYPAK
jgi:hypothetical protein